MVAVWRTRELHKLAGVPAAALSAAHPDAYIQTGKKSMKGTELMAQLMADRLLLAVSKQNKSLK